MKKLSLIICMCVLTIFAAGCNNNDDAQKNNQTNDNQTTENGNTNDTAATDNNEGTTNTTNTDTNKSDYPFREFDLEVKYDNNKEYEASYENDNEGVEASIEDDVKNERIKGNEAVDRLDPIFKKLDIDANTSEEDVISKVISAFDLDDNYKAIDVDITFNDGTEKEYINMK